MGLRPFAVQDTGYPAATQRTATTLSALGGASGPIRLWALLGSGVNRHYTEGAHRPAPRVLVWLRHNTERYHSTRFAIDQVLTNMLTDYWFARHGHDARPRRASLVTIATFIPQLAVAARVGGVTRGTR